MKKENPDYLEPLQCVHFFPQPLVEAKILEGGQCILS